MRTIELLFNSQALEYYNVNKAKFHHSKPVNGVECVIKRDKGYHPLFVDIESGKRLERIFSGKETPDVRTPMGWDIYIQRNIFNVIVSPYGHYTINLEKFFGCSLTPAIADFLGQRMQGVDDEICFFSESDDYIKQITSEYTKEIRLCGYDNHVTYNEKSQYSQCMVTLKSLLGEYMGYPKGGIKYSKD